MLLRADERGGQGLVWTCRRGQRWGSHRDHARRRRGWLGGGLLLVRVDLALADLAPRTPTTALDDGLGGGWRIALFIGHHSAGERAPALKFSFAKVEES